MRKIIGLLIVVCLFVGCNIDSDETVVYEYIKYIEVTCAEELWDYYAFRTAGDTNRSFSIKYFDDNWQRSLIDNCKISSVDKTNIYEINEYPINRLNELIIDINFNSSTRRIDFIGNSDAFFVDYEMTLRDNTLVLHFIRAQLVPVSIELNIMLSDRFKEVYSYIYRDYYISSLTYIRYIFNIWDVNLYTYNSTYKTIFDTYDINIEQQIFDTLTAVTIATENEKLNPNVDVRIYDSRYSIYDTPLIATNFSYIINYKWETDELFIIDFLIDVNDILYENALWYLNYGS